MPSPENRELIFVPLSSIHSILKQYWGYDAFRPLQEEIISSVLAKKDTLAILPTGGGKSICFQVPALALDGLCIVVSPLIALMKDQVENLKKRGLPALIIHSGMKRIQIINTLQQAAHDHCRFLYVSPERLETSLFKEFLPAFNVALIAVDEAHCISQWGYDFRPSYLRIAALRQELPDVPLLALTASATPEVQQDICEKLQFAKPVIFRQAFDRPNLSYSVFKTDAKLSRLTEIIQKVPGCGIVYCKSRKRTTEIAGLLRMHGISADNYHAGLEQQERAAKQQAWIENKTRLIICTNAFGMGIDKPDVRLVIHADMPDCLENYYQEAGRAGRDGKKSYAVLLYDEKDTEELEAAHLSRYPSFDRIKAVYSALVNFLQIPVNTGMYKPYTFRFDAFVRNFKLPAAEALYALKALESDGWLDFNEKNFSPSTLAFATNKRSLAEFEKSYPQHEPLLTSLLRTYEGIFDYPVFVNETVIARLHRKDEADIRLQLKTIASFGVINYNPQTDEPQIIFQKNRVAAEHLSFDLAAYLKRRETFVHRAAQIILYVKTTACRSKSISSYFGDVNAKDCGVCDNCLQRKAVSLSAEDFRKVINRIRQQLITGPQPAEIVIKALNGIHKQAVWKAIHFMQAEETIGADKDNRLFLKNLPES